MESINCVNLSSVYIFDNLVFILTKSHLGSYPCPLNINFYWNMGFTLGIVIVVQIVTGLFLSFHYSSDINEAYFSVFFLIREIYYVVLRFMQKPCEFSITFYFLLSVYILWIGAQFPQEIYLSYARILTLHYYCSLFICILLTLTCM